MLSFLGKEAGPTSFGNAQQNGAPTLAVLDGVLPERLIPVARNEAGRIISGNGYAVEYEKERCSDGDANAESVPDILSLVAKIEEAARDYRNKDDFGTLVYNALRTGMTIGDIRTQAKGLLCLWADHLGDTSSRQDTRDRQRDAPASVAGQEAPVPAGSSAGGFAHLKLLGSLVAIFGAFTIGFFAGKMLLAAAAAPAIAYFILLGFVAGTGPQDNPSLRRETYLSTMLKARNFIDRNRGILRAAGLNLTCEGHAFETARRLLRDHAIASEIRLWTSGSSAHVWVETLDGDTLDPFPIEGDIPVVILNGEPKGAQYKGFALGAGGTTFEARERWGLAVLQLELMANPVRYNVFIARFLSFALIAGLFIRYIANAFTAPCAKPRQGCSQEDVRGR
jgi:hypothetical protein